MTDRFCVRGCVHRGKHTALCNRPSIDTPEGRLLAAIFGDQAEPCEGCEPREAYEGALICERCIRKTRRALEDAADLCGHLRTLIDPRKAQVFDRENVNAGKAVDAPAPMNVSMVDAADQVIITLTWWAAYYGDVEDYRTVSSGFPSWITPEDTFDISDLPAQFLIAQLPTIANDAAVKGFTEKVIGWPAGDEWSIAKAVKRFPMDQQAFYSKKPCPKCKTRMVWVTPARRFGGKVRYECRNPECEWSPTVMEHLVWVEYFENGVAA